MSDDGRFADSVALVTGAASGMGRSIAAALLSEGATVLGTDVDRPGLDDFLGGVEEPARSRLQVSTVDVTQDEAVRSAARLAIDTHGRIDILINAAGISTPAVTVQDMAEDEWDSVLAVNTKGVFLMTRAVVGSMVARKSGTILNIASAAGKRGFPLSSHYVASKFAVVGFTQGVALEVAGAGVRVNAVCPGIIDTPMHQRELAWAASRRGVDQRVITDYFRESIPLGRVGTAEDVTRVVLFLCSEDAGYMTGQAINVGGGFIIGA